MSTNNPEGKNQWGNTPKLDNEIFVKALKQYHKEGKSSNKLIKDLLLSEHGISVSESTIKRRRTDLNLLGSRSKKSDLSEREIEQIVTKQMDKDVAGRSGKATLTAKIAFDQNIHLPRDTVSKVMHTHDPEGFEKRHPKNKQIRRAPVISIGIHEQWSADGHDKLYRIGFPIWAVADVGSGKILGQWVVPSNRTGTTIGYLFLCLVLDCGGIPIEMSTDCGSETTQLYGLVEALREHFCGDDLPSIEVRAYRYSRSIHNIVIERSWGKLRIGMGDTAVIVFERGEADGIYNPDDPNQKDLCMWLWAILLRKELDEWAAFHNAFKSRKDSKKAGPSGVSRSDIARMPQRYGLKDCLIRLTEEQLDVVREAKEFMEKDVDMEFVSAEFAARAQDAYDALNISELTFDNDKPQCPGCGLVSGMIKSPICNGCIANISSGKIKSIPIPLMILPGVQELIARSMSGNAPTQRSGNAAASALGANATNLLATAAGFQATASDTRFSKPTVNTGPATSGLGHFRGSATVLKIKHDRAAKREEANLMGSGLTIDVHVYVQPEGNMRMYKIETISIRKKLDMSILIQHAFDQILQTVRHEFRRIAPDAEPLTWEHVSVCVHDPSTKKFWTMPDGLDMDRQTLKGLFEEFISVGYVKSTQQKNQMIELRYVILEEVLSNGGHSELLSAAPAKRAVAESARRTDTESARPPKRKGVAKSAAVPSTMLSSGFKIPSVKKPRTSTILHSAFPILGNGQNSVLSQSLSPSPPPLQKRWSRACDMVSLTFCRTTTSYNPSMGLDVKFSQKDDLETLEIAAVTTTDLDQDYRKKKEDRHPGIIGYGYTKVGVYARFQGKEYVLTQPSDLLDTDENVLAVLRTEYALLCMGDFFKARFDEHVKDLGVKTIPGFYFNYGSSILGTVKLRPGADSPLLHRHFIATPLLPCGTADGDSITKYTGNNALGCDLLDLDITKAIHAFTHFCMKYSGNAILFCDLQGAPDADGHICLIDPQAHTSVQGNSCDAYWNHGPKVLKKLKAEHDAVCHRNWICNKLDIANLQVVPASEKTSIDYIIG